MELQDADPKPLPGEKHGGLLGRFGAETVASVAGLANKAANVTGGTSCKNGGIMGCNMVFLILEILVITGSGTYVS